jgi:hypothetical protein
VPVPLLTSSQHCVQVGKFKKGLSLEGLEGTVLSNETQYHDKDGEPITLSANLPWKVEFKVPAPDGGKDVKVLAHLVSGGDVCRGVQGLLGGQLVHSHMFNKSAAYSGWLVAVLRPLAFQGSAGPLGHCWPRISIFPTFCAPDGAL